MLSNRLGKLLREGLNAAAPPQIRPACFEQLGSTNDSNHIVTGARSPCRKRYLAQGACPCWHGGLRDPAEHVRRSTIAGCVTSVERCPGAPPTASPPSPAKVPSPARCQQGKHAKPHNQYCTPPLCSKKRQTVHGTNESHRLCICHRVRMQFWSSRHTQMLGYLVCM